MASETTSSRRRFLYLAFFMTFALSLVQAELTPVRPHHHQLAVRAAKASSKSTTSKPKSSALSKPKASTSSKPASGTAQTAAQKSAAAKAKADARAAAAAQKSQMANRKKAADKLAYAGFGPAWNGAGSNVQQGKTGVSAMQLAVVGDESVIIIDKSESNPLKYQNHPAWGQWLNTRTGQSKVLGLTTNSFCAGGTFISNGSLVSIGGNPPTSPKFKDKNGITAIRLFNNCDDKGCSVYENPSRIRLTSPRWYPSAARLPDGSVFIAGGMTAGGFNNAPKTDNPTFEYWPSKDINNGLAIPSKFLHDALPSNLYPITYLLPDNTIFMAANKLAMIYDWQKNKESRLPSLPQRVNYPWTAASTLLPLAPENNYTPEILMCGGSNQDDTVPDYDMTSKMPTSRNCLRMVLNPAGIKGGWVTEAMPQNRLMGEAVQMPDGKVLIVNGASTGVAGYGNVAKQVGASNADGPVLQPVLYDPQAPFGRRFYSGLAQTKVARMYHSSATLLPDGRILLAGSNPNADVTTKKYATEYRIEYISPPYMTQARPAFTGLPKYISYNTAFSLKVTLPPNTTADLVTVSLLDLGYHTHGVAMNSRMVKLVSTLSADGATLSVTGPPNANIFQPGYGHLFVLANGVPSPGQRVLVGNGAAPPFSAAANKNMLAKTQPAKNVAVINNKATQRINPHTGEVIQDEGSA